MENTSQLRESILFTRDEKDLANAYDIEISGRINQELSDIIDVGYGVLDELEEQNEHFITQKFAELEDYLGLTYDELRDHHRKGFRKLLVADYRLNTVHQPDRIAMLKDTNILEDLATGYSFDYIRSLTLGRKLDVTPKTALSIAAFAYKNEPNLLITLAHKYPDADPVAIKRAASGYKHPEEYIENVLKLIPELQEKYPELDISYIKAAARHYTDPYKFLDEREGRLKSMIEKYPQVDIGLIKAAVLNYKDPDKFINNAQKQLTNLIKKFPDVDLDLCKSAILGYPSDPVGFIVAYLNRLKLLQKNHGSKVSINTLKRAAYSTDPEARLKKILRSLSQKDILADPEFDEI